MAFMFEKLEVYQKALDFADEIAALTEHFPRGHGFLVDQLNRAALSIAANLAEGNGRFTRPDRRNFLSITRGSGMFRRLIRYESVSLSVYLPRAPAAVSLARGPPGPIAAVGSASSPWRDGAVRRGKEPWCRAAGNRSGRYNDTPCLFPP